MSWMTVLRVLEIVLVLWVVRSVARIVRLRRAVGRLPGPNASSWIWGCSWDLHTSAPGVLLRQWANQYGGVVCSPGPFGGYLLSITDRTAASHILSTHSHQSGAYPKPPGVRAFFDILVGRGVIWAEGTQHTRQRRTLAPAFAIGALREMTEVFVDCAAKAAKRWEEMLTGSEKGMVTVDVQAWANHISLDSIGLAGFSHDFETLTATQKTPLAAALDAFTDSTATTSFTMFAIKTLTMRMPWVFKLPSQRNKTIQEARRMLGEATKSIWADLKSSEGQDAGKTILGVLHRAGANQNLSDDEIAAEMLTLIFGAYETTSCTIAWALYELARQPSLQSELRKELASKTAEPTFDDLQNHLPLLDAIVQETLRLHPPIMDPHRIAAADGHLPLSNGDSIFVPRGVILHIPIIVMQTDKSVWGADAEDFRPGRWLEPEGPGDTDHPPSSRKADMLVFGGGPRICIGRNFAVLEIKAALARLVRQFAFAPVSGLEIEAFVSFVVRPRVWGEAKSTLPLLVSKVT